MSRSKHIDKICIAAIAIVLVFTIFFMSLYGSGLESGGKTMAYETNLFDTSTVHEIDIVMDDWDTFIENCESEEYSACTAVIDGEKYSNIGIRAKGNTSLSSVSSMNSQRYSFKLEFDQYESGKNYYGLDKLCLNNLIQDNTMMKDYLVYQMMGDFGVDSPLCSYVYITVNGEDWGLYLAVEAVEDSFLARNYGSDIGDLYKPDSMSMGGGRGNGREFDIEEFREDDEDSSESGTDTDSAETTEATGTAGDTGTSDASSAGGGGMPGGMQQGGPGGQMPGSSSTADQSAAAEEFTPPDGNNADAAGGMQQGGPGGGGGFNFGSGGMGSDDVKLKYTDDDPDSYSNIFGNAKTDVTDADQERLIAALKDLNAYTNLEETVDIEKVIRYFVVHNFVCNGDSYTGQMIHNYYLHEDDGMLAMIPWDYNLAFGAFQSASATDSVNESIDEPVSGGDVDDRPMVGWIFSDETYTEQYHELFDEFIERWFAEDSETGHILLEDMIEETADLIRPYVEKDPTKFCTAEEFETGVSTLSEFVSLRAEAVSRQLDGDTEEVDAGDMDLSDMGSMGNHGGGNGSNAGGGGGMSGEGGMRGGFDIASLVTLTDESGNTVSLTDLIGEDAEIAGLGLSDGTTVDVSSDFRNLMQIDISDVVSVTDQDGNVTDLTGYTIALNMPSGRGGGRDGSGTGRTGQDTVSQESTSAAAQPAEGGSTGAETVAQTGQPAEFSAVEGATMPGGPGQMAGDAYGSMQQGGGPGQMPGGAYGEMPGEPGEQQSGTSLNTGQLVGASFIILSAGLLAVFLKKKKV